MKILAILSFISAAAVLSSCTNTVTIYDYSGKTRTDTVYVERPGAVPSDSTSRRVPPGTGSPVPPGEPGEGGEIQHPGRWTSTQALRPGTARVQTICAPIDSMTIYRMVGNLLNGRGTGNR